MFLGWNLIFKNHLILISILFYQQTPGNQIITNISLSIILVRLNIAKQASENKEKWIFKKKNKPAHSITSSRDIDFFWLVHCCIPSLSGT